MPQTQVKPENLFPLEERELRELAKQGVTRTFAKGQTLWSEDDSPDTVWMVQSGRVNMLMDSAEGNSSIVNFCTHAQAYCPAAAFANRPYPCRGVAATEVKAVGVPRSAFSRMLKSLPAFASSLMNKMAVDMCEAHRRQSLAGAPVKSRLADLLGRLYESFDHGKLPFTRQELAGMSGTTVETTIRTLSEWEKSGVIQSERGSITVKKMGELEEAMA
jgi:CRP/FNR family transcriptional regulator